MAIKIKKTRDETTYARFKREYDEERAAYAAVTNPRVLAVLDQLAPAERLGRYPVIDEDTPAHEVIHLCERIEQALRSQ